MLIWCLKQDKDFILKFLINASFCWATENYLMCYIQYCFFLSGGSGGGGGWGGAGCWWRIGEIFIDQINYQGCQFDVNCIQYQASTDNLGIVNEFVQYVQNYFQYVYIPI